MFGSNHMKIYALCDDQCNSWKDFIFNILKYDDALECLKGQIRYDFINLINCQNDVLSQSPEAIATKVSNVIKDYFNELENKKIRELFTEQKFENKFSNNDMGYWNIRIIGDEMKIKFYRNLYIKHPIEVCLERSNVAIYEGFSKIYIKDEKNNIVYFLPKANRKIFKNNCEKVA